MAFSDVAFPILLYFNGIISTILNGIVIYFIFKKATKEIQEYKWYLLNFTASFCFEIFLRFHQISVEFPESDNDLDVKVKRINNLRENGVQMFTNSVVCKQAYEQFRFWEFQIRENFPEIFFRIGKIWPKFRFPDYESDL